MALSQRLIALDVFRGLTIMAMIVVNTPGSWTTVYPPLLHSDWHGITPTDLIFPFFLIIVGVSISLAMSKAREKGVSNKELFKKIAVRCTKLLLLGWGLNLLPYLIFDLEHFRILGILQRIALVFGATAACYLLFQPKQLLWLFVSTLLAYWGAMTLIPIPSIGASDFTMQGSLATWVDAQLLAPYVWASTAPFDPEGILSTIPAIGSAFIGVFIGEELRNANRTTLQKVKRLISTGILLLILGWTWGLVFPINKQLWTSSFVLYTGGWALLLISLSIFLVDIKQQQNLFTKVCIIFGSNAITVYVLSGVLVYLLHALNLQSVIYQQAFLSWLSPYNASLVFSLVYTGICFLPMWYLYSRKLFIKV